MFLDHNREPKLSPLLNDDDDDDCLELRRQVLQLPTPSPLPASSRRDSVRFSMIYRFGGPLQRINKMNDWRIDKEMEYIN